MKLCNCARPILKRFITGMFHQNIKHENENAHMHVRKKIPETTAGLQQQMQHLVTTY